MLISIMVPVWVIFFSETFAASIVELPNKNTIGNMKSNANLDYILSFKIKGIEKIAGKKLSLKEKIELKILRSPLGRKILAYRLQKNDTDKAQLALVLGIIGLAALFIPYVGLISLPFAIAALIIGYSARRQQPYNRKARTAIVLGWVTIGLFVLALMIAIAILTTFTWY